MKMIAGRLPKCETSPKTKTMPPSSILTQLPSDRRIGQDEIGWCMENAYLDLYVPKYLGLTLELAGSVCR
jgi:hypothetical protein